MAPVTLNTSLMCTASRPWYQNNPSMHISLYVWIVSDDDSGRGRLGKPISPSMQGAL